MLGSIFGEGSGADPNGAVETEKKDEKKEEREDAESAPSIGLDSWLGWIRGEDSTIDTSSPEFVVSFMRAFRAKRDPDEKTEFFARVCAECVGRSRPKSGLPYLTPSR